MCRGCLTDRVLEAKEHQLDLVDGGGIKVQIQLEFGDGGRHDSPLGGMDEVSKDADDLLDVFDRQLQLLAALNTHIRRCCIIDVLVINVSLLKQIGIF